MLTRYFGVPTSAFEEPAYVAGVEAGIGMSVSYDGGLSWIGGFVPGQFPGDETDASLASPAYGLEGGSDPILLAAPCGRFYLVWLQFIRGDVSMLLAALIQDNNDSDLEHTFSWEHTSLIAEANNATNGPFVDKPEASLSLTGATDCSEITEELNVTWTQFTGQGNLSNFQNKLFFGKSVDRARTFDIKKVDDNYTDTSGTATVVDPVTNDIYVFFRSFNPPAMVMTKSKNNGVKWSKPVDLLENVPMAPFDQPTVSILDLPFGTSIKDEIAPRANAFPTVAITPDGSLLMLAWHERVTVVDPLAPLPEAVPDPSAGPKAVMIYSTNEGDTWSNRIAVAPNNPPSPPGLGFFNSTDSLSGPQIQPRLSCTAGDPNQCLVIFFESRPYEEPWSYPADPNNWDPNTGLSADGFLGGYDRVMDVRGVLIDAPDPDDPDDPTTEPFFRPSFQISRYSYRPLLLGEEPRET
ncbi:MAG: sialidase family protein, partial [Thermoanaerobaculia bacterium]